MPIFYGGPKTHTWGFISYNEQDASAHFIKHYYQYLLLDYLLKNETDRNERMQATTELNHCERVMHRWKMHPNWDEQFVLPVIERLKKLSIRDLIDEYKMLYAKDE